MRAVICFLALAFVASAITAPACPESAVPKGGTTTYQVKAGYKYSFEVDKSGSGRQLHLYLVVDDIDLRQTQYLWFRGTADVTTAYNADLNVYVNVNQQSIETINGEVQPNWFDCDLTSGSASRTIAYPQLNISRDGDQIWFDLYPTCNKCSESVEFSVEVAWLTDNDPFTWAPVELVNNLRTLVFDQAEGGYVQFYADLDEGDNVTTSVVFPGSVDQKSEVVLYWNEGAPATSTDNAGDNGVYPQSGILEGNYLQQRPFKATSDGRWWLGAYVKDAAAGDPDFTIKVGFNQIPCSDATTTMASSLLLALIPLTLLFSRN